MHLMLENAQRRTRATLKELRIGTLDHVRQRIRLTAADYRVKSIVYLIFENARL